MTRKMDRVWRDQISQLASRLHRLDSRLTELAKLAEQVEAKIQQQRDRNLAIIAAVRSGADSGIAESALGS